MIVKRAPEPVSGPVGIIHASHSINFIVDLSDWKRLHRFYWRSKKKKGNWYAYRRVKRDGKTCEIALHRTIAKSRSDEEPHHKNHNTLDNRRCNLENVPHSRHPRF